MFRASCRWARRWLESPREVHELLPKLLSCEAVAVDCEGVKLSRWGRLCLMQFAYDDDVVFIDACRDGMMPSIQPFLESRVGPAKIFHDCREDAAALLEQFGIQLRNVYDTQVAYTMLLEQRNLSPYLIGLNGLLRELLDTENQWTSEIHHALKTDPNINYAEQDVAHLPALYAILCKELKDPVGRQVIKKGERYLEYAYINPSAKSPMVHKGMRLKAMMTAKANDAMYFKLNLGMSRNGVVSRTESLGQFQDLRLGDICDVIVTSWNTEGNVLFLERNLEPNTIHPSIKRRPGGSR
eukprot:GEMP01044992.1.p1 GENE.GEMP01044992.1~~GEMP01044992.1.p1  ORF type:complete len:297 (-),score=61.65 GEMP01044992.1:820-1710(-)